MNNILLRTSLLVFFLGTFYTSWSQKAEKTLWLDELDINLITQDLHSPQKNLNCKGDSISLGGKTYVHGVGTHASSTFYIKLNKGTKSFSAVVGLDDCVRHLTGNAQEFLIIADDKIIWRSGLMNQWDYPKKLEVNLENADTLLLMVRHGKGKFHGVVNWADAKFRYFGDKPKAFSYNMEEPYILTPEPGKSPCINGTDVIGVGLNSPVQFKIPVTGVPPFQFSSDSLPNGIILDPLKGILLGKITHALEQGFYVHVKNQYGEDTNRYTLKAGQGVALTPPMGWNNWNAFGKNFDETKIRNTADAFIKLGLVNHGWTYINMDDGWQGERDYQTKAIQPNEKFRNIKILCDDIHKEGLKAGIYSSPWKKTYAGFIGSSADTKDGQNPYHADMPESPFGVYSFHQEDALQWANWGIDYLKYDWWPNDLPYTVKMEDALKNTGRDIVYSLSNSSIFSGIDQLRQHANSWRTTGDIVDTWGSVYSIIQQMDRWHPYSSPGHWNDADMLVLGWLGAGHGDLHPTRLTPTEQYTHMSMWSMFASPLLLGCDLSKIDEFTLNLITNDEVIAINQDPIGKGASRIFQNELIEVWSKELVNGEYAIALCNFGLSPKLVRIDWKMIDQDGEMAVRDVWRQKDMGVFKGSYSKIVAGHGTFLFRASPRDENE